MIWEVWWGDSLARLAEIETASVDAVVTDPPYGERNANWDGRRSPDWYRAWMGGCARVLRPGAPLVSFAPRRTLGVVMGALRAVRGDDAGCPIQSAAWVHRQGHTSREGFLRPEHEAIVISGLLRTTADDVRRLRRYLTPHNLARKQTSRRTAARGFRPITYTPNQTGPMAGSIFALSRNKSAAESTGHPTQKPEGIVEYLVCLASAPGDLVLDPFCGSGTTGAVAVRSGRRFLGIDNDPAYCEMARRRIAGPLFVEQIQAAPAAIGG